MKFKYGDKVIVQNEFYQGIKGTIIGWKDGTFLNGYPFSFFYRVKFEDGNDCLIADDEIELDK